MLSADVLLSAENAPNIWRPELKRSRPLSHGRGRWKERNAVEKGGERKNGTWEFRKGRVRTDVEAAQKFSKFGYALSLASEHSHILVRPYGRDVVSVLNVSVSRPSRDVFWNVSVLKVECLCLVSVSRVSKIESLGLVSVLKVERLVSYRSREFGKMERLGLVSDLRA